MSGPVDPYQALLRRLGHVADVLTPASLEALCGVLRQPGSAPSSLAAFATSLSPLPRREAVEGLRHAWKKHAPKATGAELAAALAGLTYQRSRSPGFEMVWSGPAGVSSTYRTTEQVMKELLDGANERLLIVTYAVQEVATLKAELSKALQRGVRIRFVLEHFDVFQQQSWEWKIAALGPELMAGSRIFVWPPEMRHQVNGKVFGSLHTKCAVADEGQTFLSSANWTSAALEHNMEMGILIHDTHIARRVRDHFDALIAAGYLRPLCPA
jgi:phosphatidylserine/phosphatidylglycerophosphate/cardiolipin synthase-like enzyme